MCGRYAFTPDAVETLARDLRAEKRAETQARLNHAPTQLGPVAVRETGQAPVIELMRWGLPVAWRAGPLINVPGETAATKPTFRVAFERQRCLIVADAFYEWQCGSQRKQPWEFRLADGQPMVFAGIWQRGLTVKGQRVDSYCILTTHANDTLRHCHNRMPVILRPNDWEEWLSPDTSPACLQALMQPWSGPMRARPVTPKINQTTYDGPVEEVKAPL